MRILSIFGTRPEAVKMAPVVKRLVDTPCVEAHICVTAQHRQMLDQVLELFNIVPDLDLDLMRPNQSLSELSAAIFTHLDPILVELKPDWVLVQGDTTTVMCASLAAYYRRIRIGHIEAGLRTNNKWEPFPEEINRRIASVVADLHFAPTLHSRQNLLKEGVQVEHILVTGNPVIDALNFISSLPTPQETQAFLQQLGIEPGKRRLVLVTAHRRENFGKPIQDICSALQHLAETFNDQIQIVYPVHLNPNIQEPVYKLLSGTPNISLLPPLDYLPMVHMLKNASLVLTDSGGIQEEATALGIPTLVLRNVTERPEGVEAGVLKLVGTQSSVIFEESVHLLTDARAYQAMVSTDNPFGDGHAAERIVDGVLNYDQPGAK